MALRSSSPNALLVIDMQNDFVLPESQFRIEGAYRTVPSARQLLEHARARQWHIVHCVRHYSEDACDVERSRVENFLAKGGCAVVGTPGAEIVEDLRPGPGESVVVKPRFSAFMSTNLDMLLRRFGVRSLYICGTQYPNCIRATAYDALCLDYDVFIVREATSATNDGIAEANIVDLENVGVRCISLHDLSSEVELEADAD